MSDILSLKFFMLISVMPIFFKLLINKVVTTRYIWDDPIGSP